MGYNLKTLKAFEVFYFILRGAKPPIGQSRVFLQARINAVTQGLTFPFFSLIARHGTGIDRVPSMDWSHHKERYSQSSRKCDHRHIHLHQLTTY
jgi:hypothetical protein